MRDRADLLKMAKEYHQKAIANDYKDIHFWHGMLEGMAVVLGVYDPTGLEIEKLSNHLYEVKREMRNAA